MPHQPWKGWGGQRCLSERLRKALKGQPGHRYSVFRKSHTLPPILMSPAVPLPFLLSSLHSLLLPSLLFPSLLCVGKHFLSLTQWSSVLVSIATIQPHMTQVPHRRHRWGNAGGARPRASVMRTAAAAQWPASSLPGNAEAKPL